MDGKNIKARYAYRTTHGDVSVLEKISDDIFKVRRLGKDGEGTRLLRAEEFLEPVKGDEEE